MGKSPQSGIYVSPLNGTIHEVTWYNQIHYLWR